MISCGWWVAVGESAFGHFHTLLLPFGLFFCGDHEKAASNYVLLSGRATFFCCTWPSFLFQVAWNGFLGKGIIRRASRKDTHREIKIENKMLVGSLKVRQIFFYKTIKCKKRDQNVKQPFNLRRGRTKKKEDFIFWIMVERFLFKCKKKSNLFFSF